MPDTIQRGNLRWLILSFILLLCDQISKVLAVLYLIPYQQIKILPFFNMMLAFNKGAAFSFLSHAGGWQQWLFVGIAVIVSLAIVIWLIYIPRKDNTVAAGLAAILSGALGNLWDRLTLGHVVDFIQLHANQWYWPTFNIADIAITIGAALLIIDMIKQSLTSKQV